MTDMVLLGVALLCALCGLALLRQQPDPKAPPESNFTERDVARLMAALAQPPTPNPAVAAPVAKPAVEPWDSEPIRRADHEFKMALARKWGCRKLGIKKEEA